MSSIPNGDGQPAPAAQNGTNGLFVPTALEVQESTKSIRRALTDLRMDDMTSLAQYQHSAWRPDTNSRFPWCKEMFNNAFFYAVWLVGTWLNVFRHFFRVNVFEWFSITAFAAGASVILAVVWLWVCVSTFPPFVWVYNAITGKHCTGISLVNAMHPLMFKAMTKEQLAAGKEKLEDIPDPEGHNPRSFSLDIAKVLLQISALMYERNEEDQKEEMNVIHDNLKSTSFEDDSAEPDNFSLHTEPRRRRRKARHQPGSIFQQNIDPSSTPEVEKKYAYHAKRARDPVDQWAKAYDITYEPVSELASLSQAYCSIFWDPDSNWMVVAFKGTDPRSFQEWMTDFTAEFTELGDEIENFQYGHRGFKERIFPSCLLDRQLAPWDTISQAIQVVSEQLTKYRGPDAVCNVWFTGHSLGTALATLAYAKALANPEELGPKALLRDAYLFATPITVDATSRHAFNGTIYNDPHLPRTLWRVTNRDDFVATGLPDLGDSDRYTLSPDNLFGFSHLGIEIYMKSGPEACEVRGNKVTDPENHFEVQITSKFTPEQVIEQRKKYIESGHGLLEVFRLLQYIPVVGRLAAHATTNYYDQLDQIAIKACIDREI